MSMIHNNDQEIDEAEAADSGMKRIGKSLEVTVSVLDRLTPAMRLTGAALYRFIFYWTVAQIGGKAPSG